MNVSPEERGERKREGGSQGERQEREERDGRARTRKRERREKIREGELDIKKILQKEKIL